MAPDSSILTSDTMTLQKINLEIDFSFFFFYFPLALQKFLEVPVVNFSFPRQTCVIYVGRQIEADSSQTVCICV